MNAGTMSGMGGEAMLHLLQRWHQAGWLRALDLAFARFIHELDPAAEPSLLLAAAWLAHLESQGHTCLPVAELAAAPTAWLRWPEAAAEELARAAALWPHDGDEARARWGGSLVLQATGPQAPTRDEAAPLVLHGERLYLRRHWQHERKIAQALRRRLPAAGHGPLAEAPRAACARWLQALFPAPAGEGAKRAVPAIDRQQAAAALALRGRFLLITGGPGTGKTYTAARVLVLLRALQAVQPRAGNAAASTHGATADAAPLRVALAAPTGKAAARLRQSIDTALQQLRRSAAAADLPPAALAPAPPARTLHALLGARPGTRRFTRDAARPLDVDLLLVDEASMVNLELMAALLRALPPQAQLVLLGDRDQLDSVEAGAVLAELCAGSTGGAEAMPAFDAGARAWLQALQVTGAAAAEGSQAPTAAPSPLAGQVVQLHRSHRFDDAIGGLAAAVNAGDAAAVLQRCPLLPKGSGPAAAGGATPAPDEAAVARWPLRSAADLLPLAVHGRAGGAAPGYAAYAEQLRRQPPAAAGRAAHEQWVREVLRAFESFRVLCALREGPWGVAGLNAAIEAALAAARGLRPRGEWYVGRPLMVMRNDPALGLFNGDVGLVLPPAPREVADDRSEGSARGDRAASPPTLTSTSMRAWFASGERLHSVAVGHLPEVQTAFAMTVHKSQGSEFEHVALVLPETDNPVLTREWLYTGITRARRHLSIALADESLLARAAARLTQRASGLAEALRG